MKDGVHTLWRGGGSVTKPFRTIRGTRLDARPGNEMTHVEIIVGVTAVVMATVMLWMMSQQKEERKTGKVVDIIIYPLKSGAGVSLKQGILGKWGLENDREFMVVDARGSFLSQRRAPKLALVQPVLGKQVTFKAPGMPDLVVASSGKKKMRVRCWDDVMEALDCGETAKMWFERFLEMKCTLVKMPSSTKRIVDPGYAPRGTLTAFTDGFPILLASMTSLNDLNKRMTVEVPMNRFRPNIVIDGADPWAEDTWKTIRFDETSFLVAKPCSRCKMPTIDQSTGIPGGEETNVNDDDDEGGGPNKGAEPTATLKTFRTGAHLGFTDKQHWATDVFFGQNICHLPSFFSSSAGKKPTISLGDTVFVTMK